MKLEAPSQVRFTLSRPALSILSGPYSYLAKRVTPEELGEFAVLVHSRLDLVNTKRLHYAFYFHKYLAPYLLGKVPPDDLATISRPFWQLPQPNDREKPVCCNSQLVGSVAEVVVAALEERFRPYLEDALLAIFTKIAKEEQLQEASRKEQAQRWKLHGRPEEETEEDGTRFNLFRPLGRALIKRIDLTTVPEDKRTVVDKAWNLVKGTESYLNWGEDEIGLNDTNPPPPPEEPTPVSDIDIFLEDLDVDFDFPTGLKDLKDLEEDNMFKSLETPSFQALKRRCWAAFEQQYKGSMKRPYVCLWDTALDKEGTANSSLNLMLVLCKIKGVNSRNQTVHGGFKFGHSGKSEALQRNLEDICHVVWKTSQTEPNSTIDFKAVPYIEGGYGKYWIHVEKPGKKKNDVMEAFFVLKDRKIHIVSEEVYKEAKDRARRGVDIEKPPPLGTFDILDPDDED